MRNVSHVVLDQDRGFGYYEVRDARIQWKGNVFVCEVSKSITKGNIRLMRNYRVCVQRNLDVAKASHIRDDLLVDQLCKYGQLVVMKFRGESGSLYLNASNRIVTCIEQNLILRNCLNRLSSQGGTLVWV